MGRRTVPISRLLLALLPLAAAQLTPNPTWTPPDKSQGTVASSGSPNAQWATVLGNSLYFYDAQRSGNLSDGAYGNRVEWRNDSTLTDGSDYGLDLTGGWFDAGNFIKCTYPLGFTMFALSWGALSYGPGYDAVNQTAYLDGTLRWGYDWLMKMHPSDDVLFVQIGANNLDEIYWGGDKGIPEPRVSYPVNASAPGTDAWASTAAAFAMGSLAYSGTQWNTSSTAYAPASLANTKYSQQLLKHAETLYKVANTTTPQTKFSDSVPDVAAAYASSGWGDELAVAALALAAATNNSAYYADAVAWYTQYGLSGKQQVWNWDSRSPALYVLFAEVAAARPGIAAAAGMQVNMTGWQAEAERYLDAIVNEKAKNMVMTKGGMVYFDGDSDEASLQPALGVATLLLRYAPLASSNDKRDSYVKFAQDQIDYFLGNNPMSVPYMVGLHPNSPANPHSALAAGGTDPNNIRNSPPEEAYVLYGAVVGGPLKNDKFWDWRDDWAQNEVALDYNANVPALAAYQLATNASDPYYVQVKAGTYSIPKGEPCDAALPCKRGMRGGAIVGTVIGVIIGIAVLISIGICWWFRDNIRKKF